MTLHTVRHQAAAFVAGIALLAFATSAPADPPSRVARLGYVSGDVSFSPAGEDDWVRASVNRPLTPGDRLWTDAASRTEIELGGATIRMNAFSSVGVLNFDDRITQLQLTQGSLGVRVRRLGRDQVFEVNTPNLAFSIQKAGEYRIEVDPEGNATTIVVRSGQGEAYGDDGAYVIDSRQSYRFTGTGMRTYEYVNAPNRDEFDRWSSERDRRYTSSASARYVSSDVVGYQDLDANGTWSVDATYGNVWRPGRVASGWAPYRDGHWSWVEPWGWTWVDDAPWGFAVSHYGRWANTRGSWAWVPGPVRSQAYYAPALVAFVGGDNFQVTVSSGNVGGVAWFPLAPREVYRPTYAVSRGYFQNLNNSNTVINNTVINNYYTNTNVTNITYANRQVAGAIVAVPTTAFVQSQRVSGAAVRVSQEAVSGRPVAMAVAVAPTERSVRGAAAEGRKPPARVLERAVVARTAPPAASVGLAAQGLRQGNNPGKPPEGAARQEAKPEAASPARSVRVLERKPETSSATRPPPPVAARENAPGKGEARKPAEAPRVSGTKAPDAPPGKPAERVQPAAPSQPAKPAERARPAPAAPAAAPRPPVAAPPPASHPVPQKEAPQKPAPAERPREEPAASGKGRDNKKDGDEPKRDDDERKGKR